MSDITDIVSAMGGYQAATPQDRDALEAVLGSRGGRQRTGGTPTPTPAVLPTGAFMHLSSRDTATPNVVRNRASASAVPASIWGPTDPSLHPLLSTLGNNATIAAGETGPDGQPTAMGMDFTAGNSRIWFVQGLGSKDFPGGTLLTPGTWTLTYAAQSKTATSHTLTVSDQANFVSGSVNHTITSAWQEFSRTFTVASEGFARFQFAVGTAAADGGIRFGKFRLVPGSTPGAVPGDFDHFLRTGRMPRTGNVFNLNAPADANNMGAVPYIFYPRGANPSAITAMTVAAAVRQDVLTGDLTGLIRALLGPSPTPYASAPAGLELGQNAFAFGPRGLANPDPQTTFAGPDGAGWVTIVMTMTVSQVRIYINGILVSSKTGTFSTFTPKALALFGKNFSAQVATAFGGKGAALAAWYRDFSEAEVAQAHRFLVEEEIQPQGEALTDAAWVGISEGDSITAGDQYGGQVANAMRRFTIKPQAINFAVPGDGIGSLEARKTVVGPRIAALVAAGKKVVLPVLIGTNNVSEIFNNPTAYAAQVASYWDWARSQGAVVIASTLTAYNGLTQGQQDQIAAYNAEIRRLQGLGRAQGLADYAASAMGTWSSTNFRDQVHPTLAGFTIMGQVLYNAMAPLMPEMV